MTVLFQALIAFFAVIGLFETIWQILLLFTRRSLKGQRTRILVETDESTDPAFLSEDLHLLKSRLTACRDTTVWLICPVGAPQERTCRYVAQRDGTVRVISPENLPAEVEAFLKRQ